MKFKARFLSYWETLRASYWFVPSAMSLCALALSYGMVTLDHDVSHDWLGELPWLYSGTPGGARTILATIASSMIGLAGVVFSITIVALTLASGQFGPRLLRTFMRDRGNQITLGTFLAAFVYCLMILREIQDSTDEDGIVFVPQLSMLVAVLIAIAGMGVLIFFIHHAAASIQAPNVIAAVSTEFREAIDTLYPERLGDSHDAATDGDHSLLPPRFEEDSVEILAETEGHIQRIEPGPLMQAATAKDLIIRMEHRPGQFVQHDDVILRIWPAERAERAVLDVLRESFAISHQRSLAQDAEFAIQQLVEVAVRALSPGINDPFTAMQCVDHLAAALSVLADRSIPSPYRKDENGRLRVIGYPKTFADFLDTSYNQIRQYATGSLDVLLRLLEALERVGRCVRRVEDGVAVAEHAAVVHELALKAAQSERDRNAVQKRYREFQEGLNTGVPPQEMKPNSGGKPQQG